MPFLGTTGGGSVKQYGGQASLVYFIKNSLRLRSSASGYLNRTPATATNRKVWTWSAWVKRGTFGTEQSIFATVSQGFSLNFGTGNDLRVWTNGGNGAMYTSAVYRDPAAWYHIVLQRTSVSPYFNLYVNGVQVTAFAYDNRTTYPGTADSEVNNTVAHYISGFTSYYFDGYLAEINFIDGQALTPSSFGKTDAVTGQWVPKKFASTYGTNGFYLKFADASAPTAAAIGKDSSPNGNNWTPSGISVTAGITYDAMIDSPSLSAVASNYATLNPLAVGSSGTLSDGSLKIAGLNSSNVGASYSTIGMTTGKWYFEITAVGVGSNFTYALVEDVVDTSALNVSGSIFAGYRSTGDTYGTVSITTTTWNSAGVVIGVAVDCDNGAVYFANANTWINSGVPTSGASRTGAITTYTGGTKTLHGGVGCFQNSTQSAAINFGQRPFTYTPPTGFKSLNTYNLP